MKIFQFFILAFFLFLVIAACEKENNPLPQNDFVSTGNYNGEYWPTSQWRNCQPEEVGMNSFVLTDLYNEIKKLVSSGVEMHSLIIIKDGYIVAEDYFSDDYGVDSLHPIHSCTKSITSALVGIAIDQGHITKVDEFMTSFFPDLEIQNLTAEKDQITLKHLLTMSTGIEWYEFEYLYSDERNTFRQWVNSENKVQFVLDQPMVATPGTKFSYNTGISHVLSAILERSTNVRTDSFAVENLLSSLGITDYYWPLDNQGVAYGGNTVRLRPRDMARFGYLYLKNGEWDGKQIVPADWVQVSQQKHMARKYISNNYYGYQWWVSNYNTYSAVGYGGQWITIIPQHNLVVVFTNRFEEGNDEQWNTPERLLNDYILASIN